MDIEQIRVRIMSEAYDLADQGNLEGYTAIKVMCGEVLESIAAVVAAEREACAAICDSFQARDVGMQPAECAGAIRARGDSETNR